MPFVIHPWRLVVDHHSVSGCPPTNTMVVHHQPLRVYNEFHLRAISTTNQALSNTKFKMIIPRLCISKCQCTHSYSSQKNYIRPVILSQELYFTMGQQGLHSNLSFPNHPHVCKNPFVLTNSQGIS